MHGKGSDQGADRRPTQRRCGAVAAAVLALVGAMLQLPASPAAALTLPGGFQLVDHPTGQAPYNLTNFAWLDDGGLLATGKDGTITFTPPGGSPRVLTTVPSVRALGDHGLLGLALANDFATTGSVYLAYDKGEATATGHGMVEEWRATPANDPTSFTHERTVIDGSTTTPQLAQTGHTHAINSVVVAPDDTLFISIGDDSENNGDPRTLRAQDVTEPYGKLLHVDQDGKGVPTNPFYSASSPSSWRSRVFAYGFRNPFRFSLDPRSGVPHLGDVGWKSYEEINTLRPGDNGGWPCYEGLSQTTFSSSPVCQQLYDSGSARMPIWSYPRVGGGASVIAGSHYGGTTYPPLYRDSYFLGDYTRGLLWSMATDSAGTMTRAPESGGLATDAGGPVAIHPGPNGDMTYADLVSGSVRRLVYSTGNRAPVARLSFTTTDPATRTVSFSAADSYDLDEDQKTYHWDFGDGSTGEGETAEHTYSGEQSVQVTLTVRDQLGAEGTAAATVHPANHTPVLTLDAPAAKKYGVGESVQLSATAEDNEDGPLVVSWDTSLLHCPFAGSCHVHPDGTRTGADYTETFTDHGADSTMLVTARAQDSKGAVATSTYSAEPRLHTLAIQSPVAVNVNGETTTAADVVAGSEVQLDAPLSSSYWQFEGWSDGGPPAHSFAMPDADVSLAAAYVTAIDQKFDSLGGASGMLGGPTSSEYDVTGGRARNFTGGRIYWRAPTGAHEVHGPVLAKYLAAGGPDAYGLPLTDNTKVKGGYYAHLTGGRSIFGSPTTGAHLVFGRIRKKYAAMGYQRSCLGFPVTDQYDVAGGVRNRFQGGRITYWLRTNKVVARC